MTRRDGNNMHAIRRMHTLHAVCCAQGLKDQRDGQGAGWIGDPFMGTRDYPLSPCKEGDNI